MPSGSPPLSPVSCFEWPDSCRTLTRFLDSEGGYHGYWAQDLYTINENYGTADDLKSLVQAAHDMVRTLNLLMRTQGSFIILGHLHHV